MCLFIRNEHYNERHVEKYIKAGYQKWPMPIVGLLLRITMGWCPPIVIRNSRPTVPILVYWALGSGPDQSMVLLTSAATDRQDRGG